LLKELLRAFFAEFMERFFPDAAARLDLRQVAFLEQEMVTDVGHGQHGVLDLVAQVRTKAGAPELVLIHVELQARPERGFPERMFDYSTALRRRHRVPTLPIAVYITGGHGQEEWEEYSEEWFSESIVRFRFRRLRLRGMKAKEALLRADALTAALAVLMDRRGADLAALKAAILERIGRSRLDAARQWLLVSFVETYLTLRAEAEQRYHELLGQEGYQVARQVQMTWGDRLREEGRQEGLLLGKREAILQVLRLRFPTAPDDLIRRISTVERLDVLDLLLQRSLTADHLDDIRAALPN
jgi:hypothetical protein